MTNKNLDELRAIKPGYIETDLFNEIARLGVLAALEAVPLRFGKDGEIEVLLTKRPSTDTYWPDLYHNPGTIFRSDDKDHTLDDAQRRLLMDELSGIKQLSDWFFLGLYLMQNRRGKALGIVTWFEVDKSDAGKFFPINNLPKNIASEQVWFIEKCSVAFSKYKNSSAEPTLLNDVMMQK